MPGCGFGTVTLRLRSHREISIDGLPVIHSRSAQGPHRLASILGHLRNRRAFWDLANGRFREKRELFLKRHIVQVPLPARRKRHPTCPTFTTAYWLVLTERHVLLVPITQVRDVLNSLRSNASERHHGTVGTIAVMTRLRFVCPTWMTRLP